MIFMMMNRQRSAAYGRREAGYRAASSLFRALAHPVRLEIVALLSHGEACVCHLQALLQRRQPYISQQLMALRDAGLVQDRRDGAMVYYRLVSTDVGAVLEWARAELARQGLVALTVAPPPMPVDGCSCPKCVQG